MFPARSRYPVVASMLALALVGVLAMADPGKDAKPANPRGQAAEKVDKARPAGERPRGERPGAGLEELRAVEADLRAAGNTDAADRIAGVIKRMEQRPEGMARRGGEGFGPPDGMGPPPGFPPPPGFGPPGGEGGRFRPDGPPVPIGFEAIPQPVREAFKKARTSEDNIARLEKKLEKSRDAKADDAAAIERELAVERDAHTQALSALNEQAPEMREAFANLRERLEGLSQAAGSEPRPRLQEAIDRLAKLDEVAGRTKEGNSPELYKALREQSNFLQRSRVDAMPGDASGHVDRMRNEMQALRDRLDRLQRELDTLEGPPPPPRGGQAPPPAGEAPLPPLP